jgi:TIR domain-containing protein
MAAKVFIGYRRDDSAGHAGRVRDRLEREFGQDLLFMDVDAIPLGVNFIKVLREEVARCDVLLAVIGPNWLNARDEEGNRRLDSPDDFLRIEIAAALQRDIPVIPILLDGAKVPKADQLPKDLQELAVRNALDVRHTSFHSDMDKLIRGLKGPSTKQWNPWKGIRRPKPKAVTPTATQSQIEEAPKAAVDANQNALDKQRPLALDPLERGGALPPQVERNSKDERSTGMEFGKELALAAVGTTMGVICGFGFVVLFVALNGSVQAVLTTYDPNGGIIVGALPIIIFIIAIVIYIRKPILEMRGWLLYGISGFFMTIVCFWIGALQAQFLLAHPLPPPPGNDSPEYHVGYAIFCITLLALIILRLRHKWKGRLR